jgi:hypothetical protein
MRQDDTAASFVIRVGVEIDDLASRANGVADGSQSWTSLPSTVARPSEALATTPNKTTAFVWMADRLCWEHRLEELRTAKAAELQHSPRASRIVSR